ncbi:hypothetical protein PS631_01714 [Pseudomonas fluorescens]|uniref:Uncharacterized protein n=1 Tax=Pseudomonas fluorescens TaxID=294 RepID=A0A5E6RYE9_PSEFL|nr:hypothetical protein [Pseudomonas fluorescens]VVM69188.1 hypothetical protein PS631_01714 [Pseudomonas fluorescens]
MFIEFDLNHNDRDALLRHCQSYRPASGDAREDRRLLDALEALAQALEASAVHVDELGRPD